MKVFNKFWVVVGLTLFVPCIVHAQEKLHVVATQTIFTDIVKRIGGEKVEVETIASPKYNVHFIQPKPTDVRKVRNADLYVHNGLGLEAWSDPLLEAAGKPDLFRNGPRNVDVSVGVKLLGVPVGKLTRAHGDIHGLGNPHIQMNPQNARMFAANILEKLQGIDPANAEYYKGRADAFLAQLQTKIGEWKAMSARLEGKEIISYHEDIAYFADFLGLVSREFIEPKPGIPPTAKHFLHLEQYARDHHVRGIVMPSYFSRSTAQKFADRIAGEVIVIAQNVGELEGTDDFFSFFDRNVREIAERLR